MSARFTLEGENRDAAWTDDGQMLAYLSRQGDSHDLFRRPADGSAPAQLVLDLEESINRFAFSEDGEWLMYSSGEPGGAAFASSSLDPGTSPIAYRMPIASQQVPEVDALTFDVFGTVVDWRTSIIREGQLITAEKGIEADWPAFAAAWRAGYVAAMSRVPGGDLPWMRIDELHRLSIGSSAAVLRTELIERDRGVPSATVAYHGVGFDRGTERFTVTQRSGGEPIQVTGKYPYVCHRQDDGSWRQSRVIWNSSDPP